MGLDQTLTVTKYQSIARWNKDDENNAARSIISFAGADEFITPDPNGYTMTEVKVGVAQWRKANQIHGWFVQNIQNGDDDCREYYVERTQLAELASLCQSALDNRDNAGEILPPVDGFFFGSGNFDEWYYEQLSWTAETITRLLNTVPEDWSFSYSSSW